MVDWKLKKNRPEELTSPGRTLKNPAEALWHPLSKNANRHANNPRPSRPATTAQTANPRRPGQRQCGRPGKPATPVASSQLAEQAVADDGRPIIFHSHEEKVVNDLSAKALANAIDLFQRGGLLVSVLRIKPRLPKQRAAPSSTHSHGEAGDAAGDSVRAYRVSEGRTKQRLERMATRKGRGHSARPCGAKRCIVEGMGRHSPSRRRG